MDKKMIMECPDETLICYCGQVDKKTICAAINAGHNTLAKLKQAVNICPENRNCASNNPSGKCCCGDIAILLQAHCVFSEAEANKCRTIPLFAGVPQ